jgi:hypothetical protein
MLSPSEKIRRLELAVREAEPALARARAENATADLKWQRMLRQAEQMCTTGQSISAEFIVESARRARADGASKGEVIPLHRLTGQDIMRRMSAPTGVISSPPE